MALWLVGACVATIVMVSPAEAQTREFLLRGFADVGSRSFTAAESFKAVLGRERGLVVGGGVEAVFPRRLFTPLAAVAPWRVFPPGRVFATLRASRFRETGERVFIFEGRQFGLGLPSTVTVAPVEITGGYRFEFGWRLVPYAGAGVGWHRYRETSAFADASENVEETFTGYHMLGGAEVRFARWIGAATEAQWATVPNALGHDPNGVSQEFGDTNLGGVTFRIKIIVGR